MRVSIALLAIAVLVPDSAMAQRKVATRPVQPKPKAAPVISFMGQNTEAPGAPFRLGDKQCVPAPAGRSSCSNDFIPVDIGNAKLFALNMSFNDGKLASFYGATISGFYPQLVEAFTLKYGPPTRTQVRQWRNSLGAVLDNPTAIWDFKNGSLELMARGRKIDEANFTFVSTANSQPVPKPVVNF